MITAARFTVHGTPVPQGSKRVVPTPKGARAIDVNRGPLLAWRQCVIAEALEWLVQDGHATLTGPVGVRATFLLPPPRSLPKRDTGQWTQRRPDLDKLIRAVLDALTIARMFGDDAQVARLEVVKRYALPEEPLSVTIDVEQLAPLHVNGDGVEDPWAQLELW